MNINMKIFLIGGGLASFVAGCSHNCEPQLMKGGKSSLPAPVVQKAQTVKQEFEKWICKETTQNLDKLTQGDTFLVSRQAQVNQFEKVDIGGIPTVIKSSPNLTALVRFNKGDVSGYTNEIRNSKLYQNSRQVDASVHNSLQEDPRINKIIMQQNLCSEGTLLPNISITQIDPEKVNLAEQTFSDTTKKRDPGFFYSLAGFNQADAVEAKKQERLVLKNIKTMTKKIEALGHPVQ